MKKTIVLAASFAFSGCATGSGILNLGPDTFSTSAHAAPVRGGTVGARKIALSKANKHCVSLGKYILVTNISTRQSDFPPGGIADINFRCLNEGDPELQRPTYQDAPDVRVKIE